jgi:hypothetical protein
VSAPQKSFVMQTAEELPASGLRLTALELKEELELALAAFEFFVMQALLMVLALQFFAMLSFFHLPVSFQHQAFCQQADYRGYRLL